jgi:hypothetical protein
VPTVAPAHEFDDQTLLRALTHRIGSDLVSTIDTVDELQVDLITTIEAALEAI